MRKKYNNVKPIHFYHCSESKMAHKINIKLKLQKKTLKLRLKYFV